MLLAMVGVSYFAARLTANIVHAQKLEERQLKSRIQTNFQLQKMGTIAVGDTLPDFEFDDIDGQHYLLSDLVTGHTLISYIEAYAVG